jgi:uncharacterized protein YhbP (UPF0306 family)
LAGRLVKAPAREDDLRERVLSYLRAHHTMTIATVGYESRHGGAASVGCESRYCESATVGAVSPAAAGSPGGAPVAERNAPHAASVFYAVDDDLRLVFLSKRTSLHALHIGEQASVAVTVTEDYADWEMIQGVQLWGTARLLEATAKAGAFLLYVRRFPFVRDLAADPHRAELMRDVGVYRVEPMRAAFTDNRTGVFGREVLQLEV